MGIPERARQIRDRAPSRRPPRGRRGGARCGLITSRARDASSKPGPVQRRASPPAAMQPRQQPLSAPGPRAPRPLAPLLALLLLLALQGTGAAPTGLMLSDGPEDLEWPSHWPPLNEIMNLAARAAVHFLNFRTGSPSDLRVLSLMYRASTWVSAGATSRSQAGTPPCTAWAVRPACAHLSAQPRVCHPDWGGPSELLQYPGRGRHAPVFRVHGKLADSLRHLCGQKFFTGHLPYLGKRCMGKLRNTPKWQGLILPGGTQKWLLLSGMSASDSSRSPGRDLQIQILSQFPRWAEDRLACRLRPCARASGCGRNRTSAWVEEPWSSWHFLS